MRMEHKESMMMDMPVGMAYVPWQKFDKTYDPMKALHAGTIFPELDKPFTGKCMYTGRNSKVPQMNCQNSQVNWNKSNEPCMNDFSMEKNKMPDGRMNGNTMNGNTMNKAQLEEWIAALGFCAYDMMLYLDTHPYDKEALEYYNQCSAYYNKAKKNYEEKYGPLCAFSEDSVSKWDWNTCPMPWD